MSLNNNVEQVKAIKTIDENVVVNAGAGTGKTKVLTDRYIEILENGNLPKGREVESIVAITFTNKATQEMIERIRSLIESKTDQDDKWIRYFRDLEKANISTIHGFCGDILRENPIEAGIDPYFEILDDVKGGRILYSTSYKVVNDYLDNNDRFIDFLKNQKLDRIDSLSSDFVSLYNAIRTYSVTFDKIRKDTNDLLDSLEYSNLDIERIKEITLELIEKFTKRSKLVKFSETKEFNDFINNTIDKDVYYYLEEIVNNLGTSKKEIELQNELIERINKVMLSKELEYKWMYNLIIDIIERIDIEYTEEKRINGYLDYDDLQILVLKLLNNKEVLMKYQNKYKYFMIDEFQDTNELQKQIFYKLTSVNQPLDRNNLFVVGDPKQSIYRFRGADVDIFYDVME
ncbi:MAG TPA: UvrD-helicase domain-containing protein, partial [Tissierellaceae bacterium]